MPRRKGVQKMRRRTPVQASTSPQTPEPLAINGAVPSQHVNTAAPTEVVGKCMLPHIPLELRFIIYDHLTVPMAIPSKGRKCIAVHPLAASCKQLHSEVNQHFEKNQFDQSKILVAHVEDFNFGHLKRALAKNVNLFKKEEEEKEEETLGKRKHKKNLRLTVFHSINNVSVDVLGVLDWEAFVARHPELQVVYKVHNVTTPQTQGQVIHDLCQVSRSLAASSPETARIVNAFRSWRDWEEERAILQNEPAAGEESEESEEEVPPEWLTEDEWKDIDSDDEDA